MEAPSGLRARMVPRKPRWRQDPRDLFHHFRKYLVGQRTKSTPPGFNVEVAPSRKVGVAPSHEIGLCEPMTRRVRVGVYRATKIIAPMSSEVKIANANTWSKVRGLSTSTLRSAMSIGTRAILAVGPIANVRNLSPTPALAARRQGRAAQPPETKMRIIDSGCHQCSGGMIAPAGRFRRAGHLGDVSGNKTSA
jgi:hypothetical protein